jgi:uncharacterized protein YqjF (DUF2071 family)
MRMPIIEGLIKRRILVNYRVDPAVIAPLLPAPFRPKLHAGFAIVGICLIRLEKIRPRGWPAMMGISSENAAHRVAVEWDEPDGVHEGVFVPRRDTNSLLNHFAGGRLFPGEYAYADFNVKEKAGFIGFRMRSSDGRVLIELRATEAAALPESSCFRSLEESSAFFEGGCVGFSVSKDPTVLDAVRLKTEMWRVRPLSVEIARSSFFVDPAMFPAGSVTFDHALIMRDIPHEWHAQGSIAVRAVKRVEDRTPMSADGGMAAS